MTMFAEHSTRPDAGQLRELRGALDALEPNRGASHAVLRVPAPARPAELLMRLEPSLDASYWAEPGGYEHVALGSLATLSASGGSRFQAVTGQAERLLGELWDPTGKLRLFGGFSFQAGRARSEAWQAFGDARFVLPRMAYERQGDRAELLLVFSASELDSPTACERVLEGAARLLMALGAALEQPQAAGYPAELAERPDAEFFELIGRVRSAIEHGELEKLVLARRVELRLPVPLDAAQVLRRLGTIAPECIRFAFRTENATFLGATPERLVNKRGMAFEADALAGSIRMGEAPLQLMENQKERAEQAIVVRELRNALEPLARTLGYAPLPEIHRLKHLTHLRTRISGTLAQPLHVLELVERIHPTPAVGGFPRTRALSWIAEHEPDERGWYAGPVGWFDRQGDGDFAVALRSGLFKNRQGALYAGAGIVDGSDPVSELAETRWKLAAMLAALEVTR